MRSVVSILDMSASLPLCQRGMKGGFGSVLTALLILSGPAVTFAASGNNTFTPTNIFASLSTPAHAIYQNASLVLIICEAIFLVVGGLLLQTGGVVFPDTPNEQNHMERD